MRKDRSLSLDQRLFLKVYNLIWFLALPCLYGCKRIRSNFSRRVWFSDLDGQRDVDVWIQAASGGEAHIANEIMQNWPLNTPTTILVTTNTEQGLETLQETEPPEHIVRRLEICPFDAPCFMNKALRHYNPKLVVLLETELWPGLLSECRLKNIPIVLVNGRLQTRNMARYLAFPRFMAQIKPEQVFAVSQEDALRFNHVLGTESAEVMPNIKFDRCNWSAPIPYVHNPISGLMKAQSQFVVFGSVRKEEEDIVLQSVIRILHKRPRAIIGIFPRHVERVYAWRQSLEATRLTWNLRSKLEKKAHQGTVILWDQFGELEYAYALARSVFVGGTMAPLGGQNFLEPLAQGVIPCIGPYWQNFQWVGQEIVQQGLVQQVSHLDDLVEAMLENVKNPANRDKIHTKFQKYVQTHQGGTKFVIQRLLPYLQKSRS